MTTPTAEIVPFALRGAAGALAGWECAPPPGTTIRGAAVLVPGFTGSKEDFEALLPLVARAGFRCVAYDQRGQYQSAGPDDPCGYTLDDFSGDLLDVADQVGIGSPVHLLGHSFGGYVARAAVTARPGAFRSLTLLASGPGPEGPGPSPMLAMAETIESGGHEAIWRMMGPVLTDAGLPEAKIEFLRHRVLATEKANMVGIMRAMGTFAVPPAAVRAAGLPILVAYGDTNDVWAPEVHERFAAELGARTAIYRGAGHLPNEERPQELRDDLIAFWQDVDA